MPYAMLVKVRVLILPPVFTLNSYNLLMVEIFSSTGLKNRASNASKVSNFSRRKCIHEYLEKWSTHRNAYLFP